MKKIKKKLNFIKKKKMKKNLNIFKKVLKLKKKKIFKLNIIFFLIKKINKKLNKKKYKLLNFIKKKHNLFNKYKLIYAQTLTLKKILYYSYGYIKYYRLFTLYKKIKKKFKNNHILNFYTYLNMYLLNALFFFYFLPNIRIAKQTIRANFVSINNKNIKYPYYLIKFFDKIKVNKKIFY
jgi:ribosomal protein S4